MGKSEGKWKEAWGDQRERGGAALCGPPPFSWWCLPTLGLRSGH